MTSLAKVQCVIIVIITKFVFINFCGYWLYKSQSHTMSSPGCVRVFTLVHKYICKESVSQIVDKHGVYEVVRNGIGNPRIKKTWLFLGRFAYRTNLRTF